MTALNQCSPFLVPETFTVPCRMKDELNQLDREKLSALHYAARDEHPNIAKVLIAAGAGVWVGWVQGLRRVCRGRTWV